MRAQKHYNEIQKPIQDKRREQFGIDISDLPQNNARKTHCKRGHPLDKRTKDGRRYCGECSRVAGLAKYHRLKAQKGQQTAEQ
jgi:hypothetical protein